MAEYTLDTAHCIDIRHQSPAHVPPSICLYHPRQLRALRCLRQDASLTPAERDRVEVILRSHQGETLRELAADLAYRYDTVRLWLQASDRTWTSAQLALGLADVHDIQVSARASATTTRRASASTSWPPRLLRAPPPRPL